MITSLGKVTIAAGGTPVQLTANQPTPTNRLGAQTVMITVLAANAGILFIGQQGMNKTTGVGVFAQLPKPADATVGPFATRDFVVQTGANGLDASGFWIDGTTGDGVVAAVIQN